MPGETLSAARRAPSRETVQQLSRSRQEPAWLLEARLHALAAYERMPIPDQHTEGWRRTSLRGLPIDSFEPLDGPALPRAKTNGLSFGTTASAEQSGTPGFASRNGTGERPRGRAALVMDLREALEDPLLSERIQEHFGRLVVPESDKFTALHYAFFNAGVVVLVPRGVAVEEPVWITHNLEGPALVHSLVIADEGSQVSVVEDFRGSSHIASGVVEQVVGANAHLRYVQLQRWQREVWSFSWQRADLAQDASLRTLNVVLGGRLARNTVQVFLKGRGAQADLLGVVDGYGRQYADFQTLQEHSGDATRSDLIIHDALRERSAANFTGLIRINPSAHKTESSQEQKNILLSERARADSDPKLEILNNDVVRCTHGAAVGPVDREMVFYLQSRGLDQASAEQLIVEGFFQSTLRKLGLPRVEEALWSAIAEHEASMHAPSE